MTLRVGLGYDVHRVQAGRPLLLGGVRFESEWGLAGHSDADVLLHAIGDALLGAAGLGDLGEHFPPGDARWKDASSLDLLARIAALLSARGARAWSTWTPCSWPKHPAWRRTAPPCAPTSRARWASAPTR